MLTNSWLRTGQLYLTHHHIFSVQPTYFARSTFVLPVLGFFAPVFGCQSYLLTLTFTAYSTDFVNPTSGASQFLTHSFSGGERKKSGFFATVCDRIAALRRILDFYSS
ncbi:MULTISPECIES: hypothetical protein [unclassified Microcoleus]|uniref:hypothetical protein n=1 Tax=unclassified Microcoleus TaxID=2642155 RepID=UPI002FD07822